MLLQTKYAALGLEGVVALMRWRSFSLPPHEQALGTPIVLSKGPTLAHAVANWNRPRWAHYRLCDQLDRVYFSTWPFVQVAVRAMEKCAGDGPPVTVVRVEIPEGVALVRPPMPGCKPLVFVSTEGLSELCFKRREFRHAVVLYRGETPVWLSLINDR